MAERKVSAERVIHAPAAEIFSLLSDASRHADFDGSGSVQGARRAPQRLTLGSTFSMDMKIVVPYRMSNTVVEFEQDRLIAWRHLGRHRWRYELEPQGDGSSTLVRETFDWSTALVPKAIELVGYPNKNLAGIEKTLERLASVVEGKDRTHG